MKSIEYATLPSINASSCPVTVTVCDAAKLPVVNIRDVTSGTPSVESLVSKLTVTLADGADVRDTVNVAVPPPSVVSPDMAETLYPAVSLSMFVTETFGDGTVVS